MAAVTVTADNTRIDDAETSTGYSNIGGGQSGGSEAPFAYQGSNLFNRRITSGTGAGFYYDPTDDGGLSVDVTLPSNKTWMVKVIVSDYGGLDPADGVLIRIGSGTAAYYAFVVAGTDSPLANLSQYRPIGGMLVIPIDANENSSYNDTTKDSGNPSLTSMSYFGAVFAFITSTAKSENCGLDAIDIGTGLYLVGGDGGDTDGVWQDFVDEDEGVVANRYGYARNDDGGGILAYGNLRIGTNDDSTSTATEFTDNEAVINWPDHMAGAGFNVATIDLGSASSNIVDGSLHISRGTTTGVDSRTDYIVQGTSGTGNFSHQLRNFRNVQYTSGCNVNNANIECVLLTQGLAEIQNSLINTNSLTSIACLQDPTFGTSTGLHDTTFSQVGSGHAIELDTATTYNLVGLKFDGYGVNTADDAALDITATSGTVTINISGGGDTPTYKTAGATVIINNTVSVSVDVITSTGVPIENARVLLEAAPGGDLSVGTDIVTGLTNASGNIVNAGFGYTSDQPIIGKVRKSTSSPYYRTGIISGTITSSGFSSTIVMILDE